MGHVLIWILHNIIMCMVKFIIAIVQFNIHATQPWAELHSSGISHLISGGLPFPLEMLSLGIYLGVGVVNIITLSQ